MVRKTKLKISVEAGRRCMIEWRLVVAVGVVCSPPPMSMFGLWGVEQ